MRHAAFDIGMPRHPEHPATLTYRSLDTLLDSPHWRGIIDCFSTECDNEESKKDSRLHPLPFAKGYYDNSVEISINYRHDLVLIERQYIIDKHVDKCRRQSSLG